MTLGRCGLAILMIGFASGCAENPVTGKPQLALLSESQEVQLGREAAQQVRRSMSIVDDAELQAYVAGIGKRLAATSERRHLPWSFVVVDDATPNAFALPGGFIYVTRGMLALIDNEAELASVVGHEVAHVTARHSVSQISRAQLAQIGLSLSTVLFPELRPAGQAAELGVNLLLLKYGRDAEREADAVGFRYAQEQGYDVNEMADVFIALDRLGDAESRSALPSWLSTHPAPEERVRAIQARVKTLPGRNLNAEVGRAEYLERIDGLAYGENPRNGFFREHTFYHPDLRFQFRVPSQWQTRNLSQAVILVSPERDAAIQLTSAPPAEPGDLLRRFMSQPGVQAGRSDAQAINDVPAAVGTFVAHTQQGPVAGYAAYLSHRGNTYQWVAYTPQQRIPAYDGIFRKTLASFANLDDPEIINLKPPSIDIVSVGRSMTLAEFNRRHPSGIPIEELAILNQVAGPEATLASNTHVKRIVGGAMEQGSKSGTR